MITVSALLVLAPIASDAPDFAALKAQMQRLPTGVIVAADKPAHRMQSPIDGWMPNRAAIDAIASRGPSDTSPKTTSEKLAMAIEPVTQSWEVRGLAYAMTLLMSGAIAGALGLHLVNRFRHP